MPLIRYSSTMSHVFANILANRESKKANYDRFWVILGQIWANCKFKKWLASESCYTAQVLSRIAFQGDLPGCRSMFGCGFSKKCISHEVPRCLWWRKYILCYPPQGSFCCSSCTDIAVDGWVCRLLLDPFQGWHWWLAEASEWRYWNDSLRYDSAAPTSDRWFQQAVMFLWSGFGNRHSFDCTIDYTRF